MPKWAQDKRISPALIPTHQVSAEQEDLGRAAGQGDH